MPAATGGRTDLRVTARGLADLRRAFKKINSELDRGLARELRGIGELVQHDAQRRAGRFKRTGRLERSIRLSVTQKQASIYSRVPYAGVHEWGGTIRPKGAPITIEGRHYLSGAVADTHDAVERRLLDALDLSFARAGFHN